MTDANEGKNQTLPVAAPQAPQATSEEISPPPPPPPPSPPPILSAPTPLALHATTRDESNAAEIQQQLDGASQPAAASAPDEAIKGAQNAFVCPPGFQLSNVPTGDTRSSMYDYGVRVEEVQPDGIPSVGKRRKVTGRFYCMAGLRCRQAGVAIKISNLSTSPATEHLQGLHGVKSKRPVQVLRIKSAEKSGNAGLSAGGALSPASTFKATNGGGKFKKGGGNSGGHHAPWDRYLTLEYIKAHTILAFEPFDYLEDSDRRNNARLWLSSTSRGKTPVSVERFNAKGIKRGLLEIYDATKKSFVRALAEEARTAPIAFLHVSVDRWRGHKETFIGVRVSYLTEDLRARSHVLAVKRYTPGKDVIGNPRRAGQLIRLWVSQALQEFGLDWSMVLSVVTDLRKADLKLAFQDDVASGGGGGVGGGGVLRESCIPHMVGDVIVHAFGLSRPESEADTNAAARAIFEEVRNILQKVNSSRKTQCAFTDLMEKNFGAEPKKGRPRQAMTSELINSTIAIERFLMLLPNLEAYFEENENLKINFKSKNELLELYSLLKSLSEVFESSHFHVSAPSTATTVQRIVLLLASELDGDKPLELHEPAHYYSVSKPTDGGNNEDTAEQKKAHINERTIKQPEELTPVGRETRAKIREELFKRFGLERWGKDFEREAHLFDMVLALHPGCRQLQYMDKLSSDPENVFKIKAKVYVQIQQLVEDVLTSERSALKARRTDEATATVEEEGDGGRGGGARSPFGDENSTRSSNSSNKRVKLSAPSPSTSPSKDRERLNILAKAGLLDPQGMPDIEGGCDSEKSVAEEAEEAVKAWRMATVSAKDHAINSGEKLVDFWRGPGTKRFRLVSVVARSVLGAPVCAAVPERDFGGGGWPATHQSSSRGSLGAAYVEMVMFLRGAFCSIPKDIPPLSDKEAISAIPSRLRDPEKRRELNGMCPVVDGGSKGEGYFSIVDFDGCDDEDEEDVAVLVRGEDGREENVENDG